MQRPLGHPPSKLPCWPENIKRERTLLAHDRTPTALRGGEEPATSSTLRSLLEKRNGRGGTIQDGGTVAWMQVVACCLIFMVIWGIASSSGVFQAYYQIPGSNPSLFAHSASAISWIGTVQAALTLLVGVASGRLFDAGYFFLPVVSASLLMFVSFMLLSVCTHYWAILLCQGFLQGCCSGLLYIPAVAQIPHYFQTRRGLPLGVVTAGGPLGGVVYPILFREMISKSTFAAATRILGGVMLTTLLISCILLKPVPRAHWPQKKLYDPTMAHDPYYLAFCAAAFLIFCGILTPYIVSATYWFERIEGYDRSSLVRQSREEATKIREAKEMALNVVPVMNAANVIGRVAFGALCDFDNFPEWVVLGCTIALAVLGYGWAAVHERTGYLAFVVLYGIASAGVAAVAGLAVQRLCPSLDVLATRLGFVYSCAGLGVLIGTPIATAIDGRMSPERSYLDSQMWVGATMTAAVPCAFYAALGIRRACTKRPPSLARRQDSRRDGRVFAMTDSHMDGRGEVNNVEA